MWNVSVLDEIMKYIVICKEVLGTSENVGIIYCVPIFLKVTSNLCCEDEMQSRKIENDIYFEFSRSDLC